MLTEIPNLRLSDCTDASAKREQKRWNNGEEKKGWSCEVMEEKKELTKYERIFA